MKELKPRIHENGMDYVLVGDYYVPDLKLPEERRPIGHWGRLHQSYLKLHRPMLYNELILFRQAPHRRCRSERAGGRQAGLDYPADDESRGRDRSHESGKSDVMGAVNELHPLPGRGNHQDGTNLLLREVKL